MKLTSLDLHYLMEELCILENARVDTVYEQDARFSFLFYVAGRGKKTLNVLLPSLIFLAEEKQSSETPSGFCSVLRKYLKNKKLKKIVQKDFERIVFLEFEDVFVVIELFDNGNIILCKSDMTIIMAYENKKLKDRTVRGGVVYPFPKSKHNPATIDFVTFQTLFQDEAVKVLARELSFGGMYAEEICFLAGVDKHATNISVPDLKKLYQAMQTLFIQKKNPVVCENVFSPFAMHHFQNKKSYPTLSALLEEQSSQKEEKTNPQLEKIRNIIRKQQEQLQAMLEEIDHTTKQGEAIYEHYQEVDALLRKIVELKKAKKAADLHTFLKDNKKIKKFDYAKIVMEL